MAADGMCDRVGGKSAIRIRFTALGPFAIIALMRVGQSRERALASGDSRTLKGKRG